MNERETAIDEITLTCDFIILIEKNPINGFQLLSLEYLLIPDTWPLKYRTLFTPENMGQVFILGLEN